MIARPRGCREGDFATAFCGVKTFWISARPVILLRLLYSFLEQGSGPLRGYPTYRINPRQILRVPHIGPAVELPSLNCNDCQQLWFLPTGSSL